MSLLNLLSGGCSCNNGWVDDPAVPGMVHPCPTCNTAVMEDMAAKLKADVEARRAQAAAEEEAKPKPKWKLLG